MKQLSAEPHRLEEPDLQIAESIESHREEGGYGITIGEQRTKPDHYLYKPIRSEDTFTIRLLKLHFQDNDLTPLQCTLEIVHLNTVPEYTALSYVWGSPTPTHTIMIDGKAFAVRDNLYHFLKTNAANKDFCDSTPLWIDAVCINQKNNDEKMQQIALMADVYSMAEEVLVWLGSSYEGSSTVVEVFRMTGLRNASTFDKVDLKDWRAFLDLAYWQRLWVCQEILLATEVTVQLGMDSWLWDAMSGLGEHIMRSNIPINKRKGAICFLNLWISREHYAWPRMSDWFLPAMMSSQRECECILDRIYGVLGLVSPEMRIPADYTVSPIDLCQLVHRRTAEHYLKGRYFNRRQVSNTGTIICLLWDCLDLWPLLSNEVGPDIWLRKSLEMAWASQGSLLTRYWDIAMIKMYLIYYSSIVRRAMSRELPVYSFSLLGYRFDDDGRTTGELLYSDLSRYMRIVKAVIGPSSRKRERRRLQDSAVHAKS